MSDASMPPVATLEPVRFGEFLLSRSLITDEQWLAALADHWSEATVSPSRYRRIGSTIVASGYLDEDVVEAQARAFHDEIDVVEVIDTASDRSEKITVPPPFRARRS